MKYNIKGLAQLVRLNEEEFDKWGKRAIHKVNGINKCGAWVPNTAYADRGDVSGWFGVPNLYISSKLGDFASYFRGKGYHVITTKKLSTELVNNHLSDENIIAWGFTGHGENSYLNLGGGEVTGYSVLLANYNVHHKLADVILFTCEAGRDWEKIISKYGTLWASELSFFSGSDWRDLPTK